MGMGVLNLNKRIEDRKRKEFQERVNKIMPKVNKMLAEEGMILDAMPRIMAEPVVRPMSQVEIDIYKKKQDEGKDTKSNNKASN